MSLLSTARGRRVLFTALYISEGAPIGFLWWALPPKLRLAEVPVAEITALTALLVLPWTLKFLWAPLVDTYRLPRVGLRVWIIAAQLVMGATLLSLLGLDLVRELGTVRNLLLIHAVAAATQDVAVDALAVATTGAQERGKLNAFTQTGMLAGRAAFGGGALMLEARLGMTAVLLALVAVTWSSLALVLASLATDEPAAQQAGENRRVLPTLRRALLARHSLLALAFALISGAGFEGVGAVAGPLLVDRGFTQEAIGTFFALTGVLAMMGGAMIGGYFADRIGPLPAVRTALYFVSASVLSVALLDALSVRGGALLAVLALVYLGIGAFVATSYTLFMDLTDPRVGATQLSAYMGATNACEAWSGWAVGKGSSALGYPLSFALLATVSLLSAGLLRALHRGRHQVTVDEPPRVP